MTKKISLYADKGAGNFSVYAVSRHFFAHNITLVHAQDVISGKAFNDADIFIMPGGADLPYCAALNGIGNRNIRMFVEGGGTYLGICAGAYYACRDIEFHKGRADEITGARELAFIEATAYGSLPALASHYDTTLATATWASLTDNKGNIHIGYYHGGCAFDVRDADAVIHARYTDLEDHPPAIISKNIGNGRVILTGTHIEVAPTYLTDWDQWDSEAEKAYSLAHSDKLALAPLFPLQALIE